MKTRAWIRKPGFLAYCLTALLLAATAGIRPAQAATSSVNPTDYRWSIRTPHFVIYYNTTGNDAIAPQQGQAVADAMELAYRRLITDGHLRPLRQQPETVVAGMATRDVGGTNNSEAMAFRQWIFVNVGEGDWTTLYATCAHELFHSIQWNYMANGFAKIDDWVIEGTAPAAAYLAFADDGPTTTSLLYSHLGQYWSAHGDTLQNQKYAPSLFWYTLASRFGGLTFFDRFLQYADAAGWERAAQLAAVEGGAPDDTTFDTLFRDFLLRLPTGGIPLSFPADSAGHWVNDGWISFAGNPVRLSYAPVLAGFADNGKAFAAFPPLRVPPWAVHGFSLAATGAGAGVPVRVRLSGDPNLELYALLQGPDGSWQGLRAAFPAGGLVLPPLAGGQSATLLVARMGTTGNGRYALIADSPAGAAPSPLQPLAALTYDPDGGPRDGMPPALTATELQALRAHQWPPAAAGIAEASVALAFQPGSVTYGTTAGSKTLAVAPRLLGGTPSLSLGVPAEVAVDLGATASVQDGAAAITYQGITYQLAAGRTTVSASDGVTWQLPAAPVPAGGTLLIPLDFWQTLSFTVTIGRGPGGKAVYVVAGRVPAGPPD